MRKTCLTPAELMAFQLGDLAEDKLDEVAAHLETCVACETAAQALDSLADPQVAPLRVPGLAELPAEAIPERIGEHEILEEIGRGGMGVVYKARHVSLGRTVALKMLLGGEFVEREERARFQTEAEAIAQLHHPNIVQLYEVGEHHSGGAARAYFTLEFVEGGSLAAHLAGRPQPAAVAATWLEALARAVHYAHGQGIVHRDLKPSNVLLSRDGQAKICDFGVAKRLEGSDVKTRSGMLIGTVEYMAPEQAAGELTVGPAADIHALGALLYTMLTGRPPFRAASVFETLSQVRTQEPVPPSRLLPQVPRDLQTICLKCLQKDPRQRYATAAALAEDLRRYRASEPIVARPVGPVERAAKWARRRPAVASLLAVVGLLLVVGFALVTWQWQEAVDQKDLADRRKELADRRADAEAAAKRQAEHNERREKQARHEAETLTAGFTLDRGAALCERGEVASGVLLLARGLALADRLGNRELEALARLSLAAWLDHISTRPKALPHSKGSVPAAAFSPDGTLVATGGQDRTVRFWDAGTGQPCGPVLTHAAPVSSVAFSPDGKTLLTAAGELHLWDVATGKSLRTLLALGRMPEPPQFNADGSLFLTVKSMQVQVWRTADFLPQGLPLVHSQTIRAVTFSPDGQQVLTACGDGMARLWDATTGLLLGAPIAHVGDVGRVAFSPDGRLFATSAFLTATGNGTAGPRRGEVRLWHTATGQPAGPAMEIRGPLGRLLFSPDGRILAAGGLVLGGDNPTGRTAMGQVRLWDAATGQLLRPPILCAGIVGQMAFSPNSQLLLLGCGDRVSILLTANGALVNDLSPGFRHDGRVVNVAFSADGRKALTASTEAVPKGMGARLWDMPPGLVTRRFGDHQGAVEVLAVSRDGKRLLSAGNDGLARVRDAVTLEAVGRQLWHQGGIRAATFSADGRLVLTGGFDRTARLWDAVTGLPCADPWRHKSPVDAVAFSPDGRLALTGFAMHVQLWEVQARQPLGAPLLHDNGPHGVDFGPDGKMFLTTGGLKATVWKLGEGPPAVVHSTPVNSGFCPATLSPDGTVLAVATGTKVCLLDWASGRLLHEWQHPEPLSRVHFSPDGKTLLLVTQEHSAQLWDVAARRPRGLPLFSGGGKILAAAFSPDGRFVLTAGSDQGARLWDVVTAKPVGPSLAHRAAVTAGIFLPDGRRFLTGDEDGTLLAWPLPEPLTGSVEQIRLHLEALTGLELDGQGGMRPAAARAPAS